HHRVLHSFPTRRSSDRPSFHARDGETHASLGRESSERVVEGPGSSPIASALKLRRTPRLPRSLVILRARGAESPRRECPRPESADRKSTRLNSSHVKIS